MTIHDVDIALESLDFSALDPVTEGFVGKTKNLQKAEAALDKLCKKYNGKGLIDVSTANIDTSDEMGIVKEALKKEFGFKAFDIVCMNEEVMNASTLPRSAMVRLMYDSMPTMPVEHGKKYYDTKHVFGVYIRLNNRFFTQLTGEELLGIILHEIGHNFDITISCYILDIITWLVNGAQDMVGAFINMFAGPEIVYVTDRIEKVFDYTIIWPILKNIGLTSIRYLGMLLGPLGGVSSLAQFAEKVATSKNVLRVGFAIPGVAMEKFADSFANSYGYGPALISALDKVESDDILRGYGTFAEAWTWSGKAMIAPIMLLIDPHPDAQTRAKMILEDAKRAANDPTMPRFMRAAAKQNYNQAAKQYNQLINLTPAEKDASILRASRLMTEKIFGGKIDLRTYFFSLSAMDTKR